MIVILRRRYLAAAAAVLLLAGAAAVLRPGRPAAVNAAAGCRTIVLDAGHGGEDGGAVSPDGVVESDLNLYWKYIALAKEGRARYQEQYGPLTQTTVTEGGYRWLNDPWPWDEGGSD